MRCSPRWLFRLLRHDSNFRMSATRHLTTAKTTSTQDEHRSWRFSVVRQPPILDVHRPLGYIKLNILQQPANDSDVDDSTANSSNSDISNLDASDMARINAAELKAVQQMLRLREPDLPDQWKDVVFVCIDCEAHEFDQSKITEVGVSVLDMRTLGSGDAGPEGSLSKIQYAHYRITEYGALVNRRFVKGCPENFNFGQTVWINRADARGVLDRIFKNPTALSTAHHPDSGVDAERKVVIVGHDISNDSNYLKNLDFDLKGVLNVVRKFDTQRIAGSKKNSVGLSKLCKALDIEARHMHNAGNDAAYTLQALVLMAIREYHEPECVVRAIQGVRADDLAKRENDPKRLARRERKRIMRLHQEGKAGAAAEEEVAEAEEEIPQAVPAFGQRQSWWT